MAIQELRDNVGSVRVALSGTKVSGQADIYKYNDYYPYGSIAQSGGQSYRYDYQGAYAEKDPVTGYNNFELRMYDARIGRWLSTDPSGQHASPYEAMGNDPVTRFDKDGGCDGPGEPPCNVPQGNSLWDKLLNGIASFFFGNTADFAKNAKEYAVNGVNYAKNRGHQYEEALKNGKSPDDVDVDYANKQSILKVKIASNEIKYFGSNVGGIQNSMETGMINLIEGSIANPKTLQVGTELYKFSAKAAELYKFGAKAAEHMAEPGRAVPIQILDQAIKGSKPVLDPRGSRALLYSTEMWRNDKLYKLDVLYDKATNTIWHFQYSQIK